MKKLVFMLVVIVILLVACGPSDFECNSYWRQMKVKPGTEAFTVSQVLNTEWPPDSVGDAVKNCIETGWDGWR